MIHFNCNNCGKEMSVPETAAGRTGTCKACNASVRVPFAPKQPPPLRNPDAAKRSRERSDEEQILYVAHEAMFRSQPIRFIVYSLLFPVGGFLPLFAWWIRSLGETLTVTNVRSSFKKGIIARDVSEVLNLNVRNVKIKQSILQRVFDVGTIGISSAGQSEIEIIARGIRAPMYVKSIIDEPEGDFEPCKYTFDIFGLVIFLLLAVPSTLAVLIVVAAALRAVR